jgi:hypothetical protein
VLSPPLDRIGVLGIDGFLPPKEQEPGCRDEHAAGIAFVRELAPGSSDGKTPTIIVSVARLGDDQRTRVLGGLQGSAYVLSVGYAARACAGRVRRRVTVLPRSWWTMSFLMEPMTLGIRGGGGR